jgi:hypothetical protein
MHLFRIHPFSSNRLQKNSYCDGRRAFFTMPDILRQILNHNVNDFKRLAIVAAQVNSHPSANYYGSMRRINFYDIAYFDIRPTTC